MSFWRLSPTKIIPTFISPLRVFQDVLLCTLMILTPKANILKATLFPNPNFEKFFLKTQL